jgi:hypothetical protein
MGRDTATHEHNLCLGDLRPTLPLKAGDGTTVACESLQNCSVHLLRGAFVGIHLTEVLRLV